MKRTDDYKIRREHLKNLSDKELYERFWGLASQIVKPMLDMGKKYTTPSIERSILLRMGFSSIEAKTIVDGVIKKELMGKGCGNIVWRLAKQKDIDVKSAGLALTEGKYWEELPELFKTKE